MSTRSPSSDAPGIFPNTRWSVVLAAKQRFSPESTAALEAICGAYWYPLYAYARRCGQSCEDAQDLTQKFFARLLTLTMEGFFGDPIYGGNRNKASWKMLGFPGLPATYANVIDEYRDKRYVVDPQSIADFS